MRTDRHERLARSRVYLCTDARERQGDLAEFLDAVLAAGVDIVQLRQKGLEARQEIGYLSVFRAACERHGALLAVNDRADVAFAAGADMLHLGQDDLPVPIARRIVGPQTLIGRSTHAEAEAAAAAAAVGVDYFCAGPVWPTPTKPGRPAPGPRAGARRVVVVRAITEAPDPGAAAAEFAHRLALGGVPGNRAR